VIDTEGAPLLREVAVFDGRGRLLFEARTPEHDGDYFAADLIRPLPQLLRELRPLIEGHPLVAHNAAHDGGILAASFESCGLTAPDLEWQCTLELAQQLHPGLPSYALGDLCEELGVSAEPFSRDAAHRAAYDARFTALLYRQLQRDQHCRRLAAEPNPFSSSRVDTPFQSFADERRVHQVAFSRLSAVLRSVADDANQQSQGAVLVGEPGSGKTHLVMRLASEVLRNNRLLFVRQPTQAASVLFHVYSRTLESLVEPVGDGRNSQLDLLLIRALRRIMQESGGASEKDRDILAALDAEDLDRLGQEGTDAKRQRWERIEMRLLRWWADRHSAAGYGRQILQGLLRFCRYSRADLRESCRRWLATGEHEPVDRELDGLSPWDDEQLREEFSLQALRVVGLLSSLDAPLILVFDQLEGLWLEGNRAVLLRFAEVVKELFTHVPHALILITLFPERWQQFQAEFDGSITDRVGQHVIHLEAPRPEEIEEILDLRLQPLQARAVELFSASELEQILRLPSLRACLNRAAEGFEHGVRGVPLPPPPPPLPPSWISGDGALQLQQRVLQLEGQLGQVLKRLSALESGRETSWKAAVAPTADAVGPASPEPGALASPSPYEELFRRYRDSTLTALRDRWDAPRIIDESDDAGKFRQICLGYQQIRPLEVETLRFGKKRPPDNVLIKSPEVRRCVAFLHVANGTAVNARLVNLNQLVLLHRGVEFYLMRDGTAPPIQSKAASEALRVFRNGCGDGTLRTFEAPLDQERRIAFEFVHQLVVDLVNRELDIPLPAGLALLAGTDPDNWVVRMLHPQRA
jgi:hypothetical protein